MTMAAIAEQFSAAEERLGALRAEQVAALLRGETYDSRAIGELEQRLTGLRTAQREAEQAERAAQHRAAAERQREIVAAIEQHEEQRLRAVAKLQRATEEMASALVEITDCSATIDRHVAQIDAARQANQMTPLAEMRLLPRLAEAFMRTLEKCGPSALIPFLHRSFPSGDAGSGDWRENERLAFSGYLAWLQKVVNQPERDAA